MSAAPATIRHKKASLRTTLWASSMKMTELPSRAKRRLQEWQWRTFSPSRDRVRSVNPRRWGRWTRVEPHRGQGAGFMERARKRSLAARLRRKAKGKGQKAKRPEQAVLRESSQPDKIPCVSSAEHREGAEGLGKGTGQALAARA